MTACPGSDPCAVAQGYSGLTAWQGFPLVVEYAAGVDLTGGGLAFTVSDPVTGAARLTLSTAAGSITVTDPAAGRASWTLTGAQTAALPAGQSPFTVALTDPAGTVTGPAPLTWGRLMVIGRMTG